MKKKVVITAIALALVLVATIGGTVAWLSTKTNEVKNTFTYGDIDISLAESDDLDLKMVPGNTITKDPKVTVEADSEACWLFVKAQKSDNFDTFMTYGIAAGWNKLDGENGVYYREVAASAENQVFDIILNDTVKVNDEVTKEMLNALDTESKQPTLTFIAYAVQKDDTKDAIDTAEEAWNLVKD